jgi:hypothetical protein
MKTSVAAIALAAAAVSMAPAHAQTAISVHVAAPGFGFHVGTPLLPVAVPVAPVHIHAPVPVFVPPPAVVYVPPRVLMPAPWIRPVVYPVFYKLAPRHGKHRHAEFRGVVSRGGGHGFRPD